MQTATRFAINSLLLTLLALQAHAGEPPTWIRTWSASQDLAPGHDTGKPLALPAGTVRYRVKVSAGGSQLRVHVCNELNAVALQIGNASIALADVKGARAGSPQRLTFAGQSVIDVAGGARASSDPVNISVGKQSEILVSLFLPSGAVGAADFDALYRAEFVKTPGCDYV